MSEPAPPKHDPTRKPLGLTDAKLDSRSGAEILAFMRHAVSDLGQTIVMVTHDPVAAAYADRVVFLADGKVVDEITSPTSEQVLDRMKKLGS